MIPGQPLQQDPDEFEPHGEEAEDVSHEAGEPATMEAQEQSTGMEDEAMYGNALGGNVVPFPQVSPQQRQLQEAMARLSKLATVDNVAEHIEEAELNKIGMRVVREYKIDKDSRADWEETAKRAMKMAKQVKEPKNTPWPGASNVKYPLLTTAALQFAARAYPAIVDGPRIVKCAVMGRDEGGVKAAMADRVSQHMSYQLMYEVENWESDVDTALHQIPIIGCAFKKVYADPQSDAGFGDDLVSAFDLVVNQKAKSFETVPRVTHSFSLYPNEIEERQRDGRFIEADLTLNSNDGDDDDAPHMFLEQHRYDDLDGDGLKEPWIVTVHEDTQKVVRIKPAFKMDAVKYDMQRGKITKIPRVQYFVKIPFVPDPEGGFYDIGFGKLLESISDVIDTTINQMMDAGTLQNAGGGFMGGGIQPNKSKIELKPGQYQTVQANGQDLRASIVNLEHPGPSPVLFQLLEMMIAAGKDIAAVKDVLTGETPSNQTATSTMAAIEQGLKVFSAIYKRIFRALKAEYRLIYEINKTSLNQPKYVALLDEPVEVTSHDYHDEFDVMPVSDPNSITDMQRMAKASFVMEQVKEGNPCINPFEATKRALEAARIDDVQKILVQPQPDPKAAIAEEGMKAEVAATYAKAEQSVAGAEKARIDGLVALATAAIPPQMVPEVFPMPFGDFHGGAAAEQPPMLPMLPPDQMGGMGPGGGQEMQPPDLGSMDPSNGMQSPDQGYQPQMPPGEGGQQPVPDLGQPP